jgi:large-conductance mechanosensitive channel
MKILNDISTFIEDNRLYNIIIGTVISSFVTEVAYSIINNIIMPFFDFNNNKQSDLIELKKLKVKIIGKNIHIGMFLYSIIRFLIVLIILVYISKARTKKKV